MDTEQAQQKQRSRDSTNSPSTSTALLCPMKPSTSPSSKSIKRRRIGRTVADSERERTVQKITREEGAEEEDSAPILHRLKKNRLKKITPAKEDYTG